MNRNLDERLPEASDRFAQAILAGGERVKRYQRRRARLKRLSLAAAVLGLIAIGVASLARLNVPKPDNTVLPINPNSVVAAGLEPEQAQAEVVAGPEPEEAAAEAEQAQTGPEPEEAPAAPMVEAALKTEEEGWTLTLNVAFHQDGPFEAGEWAVICGESGKIDNGGRVVGFYERPDAASRHAETVQGMRAQYLADAGNGFARVRFEGMEGYIERKHLAHGGAAPEMDPSKHWEVFYAELSITDGQGVVREHSIYRNHDRLQCYALARLLEELEPALLKAAAEDRRVLVEEYVDGRSLSEYLAEKPSLEARRRVFLQLLAVVGYLHGKGVIHNDLSPANILITRSDNDVKLIDLGYSDDDTHYLLKSLGGTREYASPELIAGGRVDARSDIWTLGRLMKDIFPRRYRRIAGKCTREDASLVCSFDRGFGACRSLDGPSASEYGGGGNPRRSGGFVGNPARADTGCRRFPESCASRFG